MNKVLMIGIDGLDSVTLAKFEPELPNLRMLKERSPALSLTSVYPPDSHTCWASIYTGLNPARHGVVQFIDPLDKASAMATEEIDNRVLQGKTFWDIAGKSGKKVCIVLPDLGYPVWEVNGFMAGRSPVTEDAQALPGSIPSKYKLSPREVKTLPGRKKGLDSFIAAHRRLVSDEVEFSLQILKDYDWDLFFTYSSSLDAIQHTFWRHYDESDPSYPGSNPYQNVIRDFYQLYDEVVGKFLAAVDSDTVVIVFSDHGHGMRPVKLVNINEILRKQGLLVSRATNLGNRVTVFIIEKLKRSALNFVSRRGLGNLAKLLLRLFPAARKVYTAPLSINWQKTLAHVSDMSGIKSYSYGGVRVTRENLRDIEYEELRDLVIRVLAEIKEPGTGEPLLKWICRREELYDGEYITKYPDIIFNLVDSYGAGWAIHDSWFTTAPSHNLVPGTHKADSATFLVSNLKHTEVARKDITLMDIAPTVLHLLDIKGDFDFDGKSIF